MSSRDAVIEALERRLKILEDKDALWTLMNRYCYTCDNYMFQEFANFFTEDATLNFEEWGELKGREAILKATEVEGAFQGLQHSMTNIAFHVDGSDAASATGYLNFYATPDRSKPEIHYGFGGPYSFTYRRTQDGWKVTSQRLRKHWAQGEDTKGLFTAKK
ncbi:uncharacterized protein Z520_03312 [Fonsecaea multimorphosa CBS 102226]|uniref:SnoaL-like domain-containing protein n=1 Tax=Fonsecaea multimorphosa CBS 102226 TaxID=1442371 RepID=A0A0D2KV75_9EURO|nr:uncharacterized protein Z520_03312 [Fonsecaea multimorphosa CBS 102226]KIY00649.1 hypothetical protein Z520_03312 [Fonsecaea multimorphosa CBS 102226]OAL19038.1 hypothetical protein AYO22_10367 [Fonsecaea multimorphosa]